MSTASAARWNCTDERSPRSGRSRVSPGPSDAKVRSVFSSISTPTIWLSTAPGLPSCASGNRGEPTSTTTIGIRPIARTSSTGTLSAMPPSTNRRSPTFIGANAPGTDMLARIATARSPSANTTFCPLTMSAATARNGIGSASKSGSRQVDSVSLRNSSISFCPRTRPAGMLTWPSR